MCVGGWAPPLINDYSTYYHTMSGLEYNTFTLNKLFLVYLNHPVRGPSFDHAPNAPQSLSDNYYVCVIKKDTTQFYKI